MNTLLSWLGNADIKALENDNFQSSALGSIYYKTQPDKLVVFSDTPLRIKKLLKSNISVELDWIKTSLSSPVDYVGIYEIVNGYLVNQDNDSQSRIYNISSGTSAMSFVFFMLGNSIYPGKFFQASVEAGPQEVSLPFEITSSFIPAVLQNQKTSALGKMEDVYAADKAFDSIIHKSKEMREVIQRAHKVALTDYPVLIKGESGTGKELFAHAIHQTSTRADKSFIAVNCGALSENLLEAELFGYKKGAFTGANSDKTGLIQQADGGTLFLDELGEMSLSLQVKLLRFLQEDEIRPVGSNEVIQVNVRVITATHRDLMKMASEGTFREDLIYRIAVGIIEIPPLRKRREDILLLAGNFLSQACKEIKHSHSKDFSSDVKFFIMNHPWNGNVRELQNFVRRCVLWSERNTIQIDDVKNLVIDMPSTGTQYAEITENFDIEREIDLLRRHYIESALEKTGNNKSQAARLLGLANHQTLTNWLEKSLPIFLACYFLYHLSNTFLKGCCYV